jgi:hypothetical protein
VIRRSTNLLQPRGKQRDTTSKQGAGALKPRPLAFFFVILINCYCSLASCCIALKIYANESLVSYNLSIMPRRNCVHDFGSYLLLCTVHRERRASALRSHTSTVLNLAARCLYKRLYGRPTTTSSLLQGYAPSRELVDVCYLHLAVLEGMGLLWRA